MLKNGKPDREYWSIVKGIGILCVIIGHSWMDLQSFVYAFHMPLFFFVSGYLYDEKKYGDQPYTYTAKRIKSTWVKYVIWECVFILLHNFFYEKGMLYGIGIESHIFSKTEMLSEMAKAVLGCANEILVGALWFAPVLVIATVVLSFIVSISRSVERTIGKHFLKVSFQIVCIVICGSIGYLLIDQQQTLSASIQISLAVIPYIWLGYLVRNYLKDMGKYMNGFLAMMVLLVVFIVSRRYLISLANGFVYPFMYILAAFGIYGCLYIAKVILKTRVFKKIFVILGEASFFLMASHLFVLRLFDRIYCIRFGGDWIKYYEKLPVAFDEFAPIYLLVGIGVPTAIWGVYHWFQRKLANERVL